jgi:hypothetical protein
MSRDKRGNGIQEVAGSIPVGSTKSNHFRDKNLAQPSPAAVSAVASRVSSSASSSRQSRVSIHSHSALHEEKKLPREGDDDSYESNLACRDSRTARRADPNDSEVGADGPLPAPKEYISDRVILYDRDEVQTVLEMRLIRKAKRVPPRRT